jgi:hypothetical protein
VTVHVSGVGMLGAFVCHELARRGIPFTWDDTDSPFTAWRVCTGAIIPYDDAVDSWYAAGYRFWREGVAEDLREYLEPVRLVYALKNPPARQQAKKPTPLATAPCGVRLWPEAQTGWQLQAQRFVGEVRTRHASTRRETDEPVDGRRTRIHCRGVLDTLSRPIPLWGWTVLAQLRPKTRCPFWPADGPRVSLHFNDPSKPGARYYFQPYAGDVNWWWAGSDRVRQKEPTALDCQVRLQTFQAAVEAVWGQWMDVTYHTEIWQGWRPEERNNFWKQGPVGRWVDPLTLVVRPHARNGSQCGPLVAHQLVNMVQSAKRPVSVLP